jgi:soluble lytic murein transglycosylase-like protein
MARIPDKYSLSGQGSLRSGRQTATFDATAIGRGAQNLGEGLDRVDTAVYRVAEKEKQQRNGVDIPKAEADKTRGLLEIQNAAERDPDYETMADRYGKQIDQIFARSAASIRDPDMRARYIADQAETAVRAKDWLTDQVNSKRQTHDVVKLDDANQTAYDLVVNPDTPDDIREKARRDIDANIAINEQNGVLSPEEAAKRREIFVRGAYNEQVLLAANRGKLDLPDPNNPLNAQPFAIDPLTRAMIMVESSGDPNAESTKGALGLMQVMPGTAAEIARELGDTDFPKTIAAQKEYLKNSGVSIRYGQKYMSNLLAKYDGDQEAALIAYNGGMERADKWLKAGRDDSVLPKETADYYRKVLNKEKAVPKIDYAQAAGAKDFLKTRTDKDASHVDGMNDAFAVKLARLLQDAPPEIREKLGVFSGARSEERQAELWDAALKRYGSPAEARKWVAPPGHSQHNKGNAADLSFDGASLAKAPPAVVKWLHNNAPSYGLSFPLGNENWHIEDADARLNKPGKSVPAYWDKVAPQVREKVYEISAARRQALYTQQAAESKAMGEQAFKSLRLDLSTDPARVSDADILSNAFMDDGQKADLINARKSAVKDDAAANLLNDAIAAGQSVSINPFNNDQVKIADKAYERFVAEATPESQTLRTSAFIRQTGYIPDKVQAEIRRGMITTSVPEMAAVLTTTDAIAQIAPNSIRSMPGHEQVEKNLTAFRHYAFDMGYTPEEAARKVISLNDPAMAAQRDAIMKSKPIADTIKAVDASTVADLFDISGPFSPDLGDAPTQHELSVGYTPESEAAIVEDYRSMLEEGIADAGGDTDLGKKMADERFKRLYGTSGLTLAGDESVVKLPPEKAYPAEINGSYDYIREQALEDLKSEGINATEVYLQPFEQTERDVSAGRPANYQLFYMQDGALKKLPNPFIADPSKANQTAVKKSAVIQKENLSKELDTERRLKDAGKRKEGSEDFIKALEIQNEYQQIQDEERTGGKKEQPATPDTFEMPATDAMGNPL